MSTPPRQLQALESAPTQREPVAASDHSVALSGGATLPALSSSPRQLKQAQQMSQLKPTKASAQGGLPAQLRQGVEALSGMDMSEVRVHRNSSKPATLQAHAFAQGKDIHLAPGQERHLPHEAWHVVQQAQGRVQPTRQLKNAVPVNDDRGLEREADVMGAKAARAGAVSDTALTHQRQMDTSGGQVQLAALNGHPEAQSFSPPSLRSLSTVATPAAQLATVILQTDTSTKKKIRAEGTVDEFKNGSSPGKKGWLGVESYRSYYSITDGTHENTGSVGPFANDFTNPEAGHVLAQQNGGNGKDPENIFAQDGGTNNGKYKAFEIKMRKDLDLYEDDDTVKFTSYLKGGNITAGKIADAGGAAGMDISSDDSD